MPGARAVLWASTWSLSCNPGPASTLPWILKGAEGPVGHAPGPWVLGFQGAPERPAAATPPHPRCRQRPCPTRCPEPQPGPGTGYPARDLGSDFAGWSAHRALLGRLASLPAVAPLAGLQRTRSSKDPASRAVWARPPSCPARGRRGTLVTRPALPTAGQPRMALSPTSLVSSDRGSSPCPWPRACCGQHSCAHPVPTMPRSSAARGGGRERPGCGRRSGGRSARLARGLQWGALCLGPSHGRSCTPVPSSGPPWAGRQGVPCPHCDSALLRDGRRGAHGLQWAWGHGAGVIFQL